MVAIRAARFNKDWLDDMLGLMIIRHEIFGNAGALDRTVEDVKGIRCA